MKLVKKFQLGSIVVCALYASTTFAANNSVVNFSATISSATCDVNTNINGNNIDLGGWVIANFKKNETSTFLEVTESAKEFSVQLSNCSDKTKPYENGSIKLTGASAWKSNNKFFSNKTTNETGVIIRNNDTIVGNSDLVKIADDGIVTFTANLASTYPQNTLIQKGSISVPVTFSYITN
ncbi:TPA: type 1 fimbrial protein [Proteus mirabilis]|nr:type 1 fimbrial protein [Proteus mirabilis]